MTAPPSQTALSRAPVKLLAAVGCGLALVIYAFIFFDGSASNYRLWYYTPSAIAVGPFFVDRFRQGSIGRRPIILDLIVITLCLLRPFTGYPPFSGHAVFAAYLLLTCPSLSTRIPGLFLLAVTLYAKLIIWKGDTSLVPGLLVGLAAGLIYRRITRKE